MKTPPEFIIPVDRDPLGRSINIPMPTRFDVSVYVSQITGKWRTCVHVVALNADDPEAKTGYYGSAWDHDHEPTQEDIRAHVVDFLDHEVRHWLGMDPHGEDK